MSLINAIVLGMVQGMTEFLPVSSSGHLVILQSLFGIEGEILLFDVMLHFGTLLAVIAVFYRDIVDMIRGVILWIGEQGLSRGEPSSAGERNEGARLALLTIIGALPTAIIGFIFKERISVLFESVGAVGIALLLTGTLLFLSSKASTGRKDIGGMRIADAMAIGFAQGCALIPGLSRSGATISMALFRGLGRDLAGRYSFILSIPVIFGVAAIELLACLKDGVAGIGLLPILAGTAAAAVTGFFALKVLMKILREGRLNIFAIYCWALGGAVILYSLL